MKVKHYKVKKFIQEAKKAGVSDKLLVSISAVFLSMEEQAQRRSSLGAGLHKIRLASKSGRGKSGGSRSILAVKKEKRLIWLHLFAKNDKSNITTSELTKLKRLADILLKLEDVEINRLIELGELEEI